jgi:L-lactate dehydrogenase (cytochrome)
MSQINPQDKIISLEEIAQHYNEESCWVIIGDCVYDFTELLTKHPAGREIILEHAGADGTSKFEDQISHNKESLQKYLIGKISKLKVGKLKVKFNLNF